MMEAAALTAELICAGGTGYAITSGVTADPATAGRITVRIGVGDVPPDSRIAEITVWSSTGAMFSRSFIPRLTVPPGGTLSVTFGIEDMRTAAEEP